MKQASLFFLRRDALVAPRAGAWIETRLISGARIDTGLSPPARGRGLKPKRLG